MNFKVVKEEPYVGKIEFLCMKKIALGVASRCYNIDMSELIDPILVIAQQQKLNIKITERMVFGSKMIYLEYENDDIVKAIHILNVSTVLN